MNKKIKEYGEPKVQRHQEAKQKCKIYQRSLSGKFRTSQFQSSQTPLPGQFAVQKPQLKLTTNIRMIMKDNRPETAAKFLNNTQSRKLSIRKSASKMERGEGSLKRFPENNSLEGTRVIQLAPLKDFEKRERGEEMRKTSYLVKSKGVLAKYSSGHRAIKLQNHHKLRLSSPKEEIQKAIEQQKKVIKRQEANFLSVEYYLFDDATPESLMNKYQMAGSKYVLGFSRWFDLEGNSTWKKCRVLGFCNENDRWDIEWLHNSKTKQVSRANLYFEGEDRVQFEKKLKLAQQTRLSSQVYYKYNIQVDQASSLVRDLTEQKMNSIMKKTCHPEGCQKFRGQVASLYLRANKQAEFNAQLPYDSEKKAEFEHFLPKYLFQPHQQHMRRYQGYEIKHIPTESRNYFESTHLQFKEKTSLNNKNRLNILATVTEIEVKYQNWTLLHWKAEKRTLDNLVRHSKIKLTDFTLQIQKVTWSIQQSIGGELDQMYLDKKNCLQQFQKQTREYSAFLSMIIIRIEALVRKVLTNTYTQILTIFKIDYAVSQQEVVMKSRDVASCYLQLKLAIRQGKVQCEPSLRQIKLRVEQLVEVITDSLKALPCPTKSYLQSFRQNGILHIESQPFLLNQERNSIDSSLKENLRLLGLLLSEVGKVTEQMLGISPEVKNKLQRKCNYTQIKDFVSHIKELQWKLNQITDNYKFQTTGVFRVNLFIIQNQEILSKVKKRVIEGCRDLYRLIFDKISKENEKIEKTIIGIQQKLQMQPKNIIQMLELQKLVREQSHQQLDKVYSKLKELPSKLSLLESIQPLQYRQFQVLNHVYIFPLRLREKVKSLRKDIEIMYRKRFGQQLARDAGKVLEETRKCNEEMLSCFKIQSLDEMCQRFKQFDKLNLKISDSLKDAGIINEREQAMSVTQTDFGRLLSLSKDFDPYFTIARSAKNYQVHIDQQATGTFSKIDHVGLEKELEETKTEIARIKQLFCNNTRMLRISMEVQQQYSTFAEHMPLIKALRNPDLRNRHWVSIRDLIATDPQHLEVSLKKMINAGVQTKLLQLQQISTIATRELVYQRRLIRLKKQWKEVKYQLQENDGFSVVKNLKLLCERVQMDIFQIQQMLGASFIKFLQGEILCWRNQVLYKAYQLLEKWQKLQNEVMLLAAIFSKPRAQTQMPRQHFQFQLLQKSWKILCNHIDSQPAISDILQGRAIQSLNSLETISERIRKQLYAFFEDKKREYARLACISDDQFVDLLSYDDADPGENPVFQQTVRKCFQNIKALIRNDKKQIVQIKTCSGQQINLRQREVLQNLVQFILPNEIIMELENEIKQELKSSLGVIVQNPQKHITQLLILYQRLIFTTKIEEQLIANQHVSEQLIRELQLYRDQLVSELTQNVTHKQSSELLQALYHLQLAMNLWRQETIEVFSFQWISQPRIHLKNDEYMVEIGLLSQNYGFEIVDLDEVIMEEWTVRMFCSMAGAIKDKGMAMIAGDGATGKISAVCKMAALFGRKQHILEGSSLVSSRNLLELIRMAASGLWVILRTVQNLERSQLSILSRNIQNLWINFLTQPTSAVMIQNAGVIFKTTNLHLFTTTTLTNNTMNPIIKHMFGNTFRVCSLSKVNLQFIVGAKLLLLKLEQLSSSRICFIVEYILKKFKHISDQMSIHSDISFIVKLFSNMTANQVKSKGEELFQLSLEMLLLDLVQDQKKFQKIAEDLFHSFNMKLSTKRTDNEAYKSQFVDKKYHYSHSLLNVYSDLIDCLSSKNVIILMGPADTGKSALIKLLQDSGRITLTPICPNAYSLTELYGKQGSNGIICCLIEKILKKLKRQDQDSDNLYGLLLDGQLGMWTEPLAKIVNSGHLIQPNGNRLLIQQNIKMIFQCCELKNAGPDLLMQAKLLPVSDPLKWQNVLNWYLNTQFQNTNGRSYYLKYFQLLIPYIVDPMMQFYQTTQVEQKASGINTFIPANSLVLSLLKLYQSLLKYHFMDDEENSMLFQEKMNSDSFNLFIMALVWTFGVSLPQEARRSFQRHFKYLIKRAVQVHMSAVSKDSLPSEDHDLFNTFYNQGRWEQWKRDELYLHAPTMILSRPADIGLSFIIERSLERGDGVLIAGPNNGLKTIFMQEFQRNISQQAYKLIKVPIVPNSTANSIKNQLVKQMNKQKYSFNFHGFAHGKKTLILIRDISLPLLKENPNGKLLNIYEFLRHYYVTCGWYLSDSQKHHTFKKLIFCSTMNYHHPLPASLTKYTNVINRPLFKQDMVTIVKEIVKDLVLEAPSICDMIVDLHFSAIKQFSSATFVPICCEQAILVAKGLSLLKQSPKSDIFKMWIYLSEKIYLERLRDPHMQRLFYLINGVLIERQKIRYKSIKHSPDTFSTFINFSSEMSHFTMTSFKKEVERRWKIIVEESFSSQGQPLEYSFKAAEKFETTAQIRSRKIMSFKGDLSFNEPQLKLIAYICSTFDMHGKMIMSLSISNAFQTPSLDLQEALLVSSALRKGKLFPTFVPQGDRQKWKQALFTLIEEILTVMENKQTSESTKQFILFFFDFKSGNDFILDDLLGMKINSQLPYFQELQKTFEMFIQNRVKYQPGNNEGNEDENQPVVSANKPKPREQRYENLRRQKQRELKEVNDMVIKRIKVVINFKGKSVQEISKLKIFEYYDDLLRHFAILNICQCKKINKNTEVRTQNVIDDCLSANNPLITDVPLSTHDINNKRCSYMSKEDDINLTLNQELFLDKISQKLAHKFCLLKDEEWLRGLNNDFKTLYAKIKQKIQILSSEKMDRLSEIISTVSNIRILKDQFNKKAKYVMEVLHSVQGNYEAMKKQKIQRQLQYERCMDQNQNIEKTIISLEKEKIQLSVSYERMIEKNFKDFCHHRDELIQFLKGAKDRKFNMLTNQLRAMLEGLVIVLEKKIKKDEEPLKEIIKDITTLASNSKIIKKLSNLLATNSFNISQKIIVKLKEILKDVDLEKIQKRGFKEEREETFLDITTKKFKLFFNHLFDCYHKVQQKEVKECLKRLNEVQKTDEKIKENLSRNLKSPEYQSILENYQLIREQIVLTEEKLVHLKAESLKSQQIDQIYLRLLSFSYPSQDRCRKCNEKDCKFMCTVAKHFDDEQIEVNKILQNVHSFAFTLAVITFFNFERFGKQIRTVVHETIGSFSFELNSQRIDFIQEDLQKLIHLTYQSESHATTSLENFNKLESKIEIQVNGLMRIKQEFDSLSFLSLVQFIPGTIVIGLEAGSVGDSIQTWNNKSSSINSISMLFQEHVINSSQLLLWVRRNGNYSPNRFTVSSRVLGTLKNISKAMISLDTIQSKQDKVILVVATSKEEYINCMKIINREMMSSGFTLLLIASSQNISIEDYAYTVYLKDQSSDQLIKKIENIVMSEHQKGEIKAQIIFKEYQSQKQKAIFSVEVLVKLFSQNALQQLLNMVGVTQVPKKASEEDKNLQIKALNIRDRLRQQKIKIMQIWVDKCIENFQLWSNMVKSQDITAKTVTQKTRGNQTGQKIAKTLKLLFQFFIYLQEKGWLPTVLSIASYQQILKKIFAKENLFSKKNSGVLKKAQDIKVLTWNRIASLYPRKELVVFLVFMFVFQLQHDNFNQQSLPPVLSMCLQMLSKSIGIQKCINNEKQLDLTSIYFNYAKGKKSVKLKRNLKNYAQSFEKCLKDKELVVSMGNNSLGWLYFVKSLTDEVVGIPPELHSTNKLLILWLLCLFKPGLVYKWTKKNDSDNLLFRPQQYQLHIHNNVKSTFYKISEISYQNQWVYLPDRIYYNYHNLGLKEIMLNNYGMQEVVDICKNYKIGFNAIDVTTFLWKFEHVFDPKVETIIPSDVGDETERKFKDQQKFVEELKGLIKSQNWLLFNLNHSKVMKLSIWQIYGKIFSIFEAILYPEVILQRQKNKEGVSKMQTISKMMNKNVDMNQYRYMLIFLADTEEFGELKEGSRELISHWLHTPNRHLYTKEKQQQVAIDQGQYGLFASNFVYEYYLGLHKFKKNKKEYERLSFIEKKGIFDFVFICHKILNMLINNGKGQIFVLKQYLKQVMNRIKGSLSIIKQNTKYRFTQAQMDLIQNYHPKYSMGETQKDSQKWNTLMKLQEFIMLLIQYTFQINLRSKRYQERTHITYQFIATVRQELDHLQSYELDHVIHHLKITEKQFDMVQKNLIEVPSGRNIDEILVKFDFESYKSYQEQDQSSKVRNQEDKLIKVVLSEYKIDFVSKSKEIEEFYTKQISKAKGTVQMLKIFNLLDLLKCVRGNINKIESVLEKKHSSKLSKLSYKQRKNLNLVVFDALTQLLESQQVQKVKQNNKHELNRLYQSLITVMLDIYKKMSALAVFITQFIEVVQEFQVAESHRSEQQIECESEDQEQNERKRQDLVLRQMIKRKVRLNAVSQQLMKKLHHIYNIMTDQNNPCSENLKLSQMNELYMMICQVQKKSKLIQKQTEQAIQNYHCLQEYNENTSRKIEESIYSAYDSTMFTYRFDLHTFNQIVEIGKLIHAKRHHQEVHLLNTKLTVVGARKVQIPQSNETYLYFMGFNMVNAKHRLFNNKLLLQGCQGQKDSCQQLYIQVLIQEDFDTQIEQQIDQEGHIWFQCPFYLVEHNKILEHKERVRLMIHESEQDELIKANIYLSSI